MSSVINQIADILITADRCKTSYLWALGVTEADRQRREATIRKPEVTWTEGGHVYTARYDYYESWPYLRACGIYTRDGQRTTVTVIRNSYERLRTKETTPL